MPLRDTSCRPARTAGYFGEVHFIFSRRTDGDCEIVELRDWEEGWFWWRRLDNVEAPAC